MGPCKGFEFVVVAVLSACGSVYTANAAAAVEQSMIIGGTITNVKDALFVVQVFENLGNKRYKSCGGSVIGKVHVLTAAHCVNGSAPQDLSVVYNSNVLSPFAITKRGVTKIHVNPNYKIVTGSDRRSSSAWDVAVLLVDETIPVTPIEIAPSSFKTIPAGKLLTIAGWGKTQANAAGDSSNLFTSTFTVISHLDCRKKLPFRFLEDVEFCVTTTSKHAPCGGDSGGPVYDSKTNMQYGVVSWSGCGDNGVGVEADLTEPSMSNFLKPFLP